MGTSARASRLHGNDRLVLRQTGKNRIANRIVNEGLMLEADLGLRRMHIHIDILVRNRHKQDDDRKCARRQNVAIGLADRMQNDLVAHQPAIDKEEHRIPVVLLNVRTRREQMDLHAGSSEALFVFHKLIEKILAENLKNAFAETSRRRRGQDLEAALFSRK